MIALSAYVHQEPLGQILRTMMDLLTIWQNAQMLDYAIGNLVNANAFQDSQEVHANADLVLTIVLVMVVVFRNSRLRECQVRYPSTGIQNTANAPKVIIIQYGTLLLSLFVFVILPGMLDQIEDRDQILSGLVLIVH